MNELKKYQYVIISILLIVGVCYFAYTKIQPTVVNSLKKHDELKTVKEADQVLSNQLNTAKEKAERKKRLRMLDDMTKRVYQQDDGTIDPDATFAFLLDDVIEILRKNHVKTHSIRSTINPEDDVFVKGDPARYAACRLEMKMVSDYKNFKNFLEDLYKYPYLVNINSIEIFPYQKNKKILLINFTITLYASRSDEEAENMSAAAGEGENAEEEEE